MGGGECCDGHVMVGHCQLCRLRGVGVLFLLVSFFLGVGLTLRVAALVAAPVGEVEAPRVVLVVRSLKNCEYLSHISEVSRQAF